MDQPPRKRLKKLSSAHRPPPPPPEDIIPKKKNSSVPATNGNPQAIPTNEEDSDSIEAFICDRIEYEGRTGGPVSSSESVHSTDGENFPLRRRRDNPSEDAEQNSDQEYSGQDGDEQEEKPVRLVGKQALEAKRKQGLIPKKEQDRPAKRPQKSPALLKPRKQREKSSEAPKKYTQFAEFDNEADRKRAELVTLILVRWWYALDS